MTIKPWDDKKRKEVQDTYYIRITNCWTRYSGTLTFLSRIARLNMEQDEKVDLLEQRLDALERRLDNLDKSHRVIGVANRISS